MTDDPTLDAETAPSVKNDPVIEPGEDDPKVNQEPPTTDE